MMVLSRLAVQRHLSAIAAAAPRCSATRDPSRVHAESARAIQLYRLSTGLDATTQRPQSPRKRKRLRALAVEVSRRLGRDLFERCPSFSPSPPRRCHPAAPCASPCHRYVRSTKTQASRAHALHPGKSSPSSSSGGSFSRGSARPFRPASAPSCRRRPVRSTAS